MDFDAYVQSKGYSGRIPSGVAKQLHAAWIKDTGGGWKPSSVAVTNAVTGDVLPAFLSSPNSAQLMQPEAGKVRYEVGNDGQLYMVEGTAAHAVTNAATGAPLEARQQGNGMMDVIAMMQAGQVAPPQSRKFFGFGGGSGSQATPTPTPVPVATPTPAPVPAATPAATRVFSREEFKQMSGQDLAPGEYEDAKGRPFTVR
jgi:hypothetical protein